MFYQLYEINHAALQPLRVYADSMKLLIAHGARLDPTVSPQSQVRA